MNIEEAIKKIRELDLYGSSPAESKKAIIPIVRQIHEPLKVVIPHYVADWIEYCKEQGITLLGAFEPVSEHGVGLAQTFKGSVYKCTVWASHNQEIFARAWLDGYEIEKEKKFRVKFKLTNQHLMKDSTGYFGFDCPDSENKAEFTKQELEQAGFGGVFDNDMFEVEVVE